MIHQHDMFTEAADVPNRDAWALPWDRFSVLDDQFHFIADMAAERWSAKCKRFFTPVENSLAMQWSKVGRGWLYVNPPFSALNEWSDKVAYEAGEGCRIVMIAPAHKTEQEWFHRNVLGVASEVRPFRGRVSYLPPAGVHGSKPMFPSIAIVYSGAFRGQTIMTGVV